MYNKIFSNTFASREDCEMFLMVLKQQWPQMTELSKDVILPYRRQLAPKSVTLESDLNWSMEF